MRGEPCVIVANKCDLPVRLDLAGVRSALPTAPIVQVSAMQGTGPRSWTSRSRERCWIRG